jgi:glycosyltransferase involved in cell wall biosynthesis
VLGGFGIASLLGAGQCQTDGVPYAIWSGAWPRGEKRVSPLAAVIRKRLVRRASAFIAYGTAAAEYLVSLGAAPDRVFCAWNTVDLEDIASAASAAAAKRGELVTKYELAKRNLLFVGSLVERKGVRELIGAALIMEPDEPDWALHLVGAGPLREELEATTTAAGKEANFRFHGLRPPADVAELLGVANGFVLPTKREAWGLVINEAMACGVPVVTSPWAGATRDLITHGLTGYVVEPNDTRSLATVMSRLVSGDPVCAAVGQAGAEAIRAKASLERSAEGFVSAVKCALEGRRDD